jgi:hypothetical protein
MTPNAEMGTQSGETVELSRDDFRWLLAEAYYAQQRHSRRYANFDRVERISPSDEEAQ